MESGSNDGDGYASLVFRVTVRDEVSLLHNFNPFDFFEVVQ